MQVLLIPTHTPSFTDDVRRRPTHPQLAETRVTSSGAGHAAYLGALPACTSSHGARARTQLDEGDRAAGLALTIQIVAKASRGRSSCESRSRVVAPHAPDAWMWAEAQAPTEKRAEAGARQKRASGQYSRQRKAGERTEEFGPVLSAPIVAG